MSIIKDSGLVDIAVLDPFLMHLLYCSWALYHLYLYVPLDWELTNYGHHLFMHRS